MCKVTYRSTAITIAATFLLGFESGTALQHPVSTSSLRRTSLKLHNRIPLIENNESILQDLTSPSSNRRSFLTKCLLHVPAALLANSGWIRPATAAAPTSASLLSDLRASREKLESVPSLIQSNNWEGVRTVLKTPPVNFLWNMGENSNPVDKLARMTGDVDLFETKDDLSISLQMCDQFSYDNVFVYFQPGNGKTKTKEPLEMAEKSMKLLDQVIRQAEENQ